MEVSISPRKSFSYGGSRAPRWKILWKTLQPVSFGTANYIGSETKCHGHQKEEYLKKLNRPLARPLKINMPQTYSTKLFSASHQPESHFLGNSCKLSSHGPLVTMRYDEGKRQPCKHLPVLAEGFLGAAVCAICGNPYKGPQFCDGRVFHGNALLVQLTEQL